MMMIQPLRYLDRNFAIKIYDNDHLRISKLLMKEMRNNMEHPVNVPWASNCNQ